MGTFFLLNLHLEETVHHMEVTKLHMNTARFFFYGREAEKAHNIWYFLKTLKNLLSLEIKCLYNN